MATWPYPTISFPKKKGLKPKVFIIILKHGIERIKHNTYKKYVTLKTTYTVFHWKQTGCIEVLEFLLKSNRKLQHATSSMYNNYLCFNRPYYLNPSTNQTTLGKFLWYWCLTLCRRGQQDTYYTYTLHDIHEHFTQKYKNN